MAYELGYNTEEGTPFVEDEEGQRIRSLREGMSQQGFGVGDEGRMMLPEGVTDEMINSPYAMGKAWNTQKPSLWDQISGNNYGGYIGGTAGMVAPGYMPGNLSSGQLYGLETLFNDYNTPVNGVDVSQFRKQGYTPEELQAREAFISANPGYGQVTASHVGNGGFKSAGPSQGDYLSDINNVKYDPTYGYISPLSNFAYSGGKGGHGEAVRALAKMALSAVMAGMNAPMVGAEEAAMAASEGINAGGLDGMMADSAANYNSAMGFNPTGGSIGMMGELQNIYRSPEVQTLKKGYDTVNKVNSMYNTAKGLFSNNDVPSISGMLPAAQPQVMSSGLSDLYSSDFGNNNLDPYGLNQRRRSFGRR